MYILQKIIKIFSLITFLILIFYLIFIFSFELQPNDYQVILQKKIKLDLVNNKQINMLFVGDIMIDRHVGEKIKENGLSYILGKLKEKQFFVDYDIVGCNLEGAVTDGGMHYNPIMSYDFAFKPELISELSNYGFNFLNLANNHFTDQGERGIIETRKNLDAIGINYSGCRDGNVGDCSYFIKEIDDRKIGFIGLSQVYSEINLIEIEKLLNKVKQNSDFILVNIHWGNKYEHNFNVFQQDLGHFLVDNGVDLIVGHHPHVIQGIELYKNKLIFYSLGNFIFDQYFSSDTQEGLAVKFYLDNDKQTYTLLPIKSKYSQADLMNLEEKNILLEKIVEWSDIEEKLKQQIKQGIIKIK